MRAYQGFHSGDDAPSAPEALVKRLYVQVPPRLVRSLQFAVALDLIFTVVVWFWTEDWNVGEFWSDQVMKFKFQSASLDVIILSLIRGIVLAALSLRARALSVRVKADGSVEHSIKDMMGQALCITSGAYCLFKLGYAMASAEGSAGSWAVSGVAAALSTFEGVTLERMRRTVRTITSRSLYEKLRTGEEDELEGIELQEEVEDTRSQGLSIVQLARVLKPYFWPKGDTPNACMNRTRSTLTWVFVIASKVCSVTSPFFLSRATNALYRNDVTETMQNVGFYALLAFSSKVLKEAQSLVYLKVKQQAYIEIAEHAFSHLHTLSLQWHLKKKMGNVVRSMDRGTDAANNLITYLFLYLVPAIGECIATVIVFYVKFSDWRLATAAFASLMLYGYVTVSVTLWRKKFRAATNKHDNDYHDKATDSIINYETVKYFTNEKFEVGRVKASVEEFQRFSVSTQASLSVLNSVQQLILNSTLVLGLYFSAQSVRDGSMNVGDFVSVNTYMVNLFTPLYFLGTVYNIIIQAFVDIRNLSELLKESPDIVDAPGAIDMPTPAKNAGISLEFRDVWFWYPSQPSHRGLRGISFYVEPGTTTALVGHTGAGKTTISRLLFRFYDPVKGMVLMNGYDIKSVTQQSVRRAIGVVPQDTVMFNDTVLHNLRYGRLDATMEEVEAAAEAAQIKSFIEQQPEGWNTKVGERGLKLSGGEKQRVAIARCLLKDPPIVLLDEATSALDSRTEKGVQEALNGLKTNRTTVVIAHRLSTIRNADQILVLREGQVIERGTHDSLMELDGEYAIMWNIQVQERERLLSMEAERLARAAEKGGIEESASEPGMTGSEEEKDTDVSTIGSEDGTGSKVRSIKATDSD